MNGTKELEHRLHQARVTYWLIRIEQWAQRRQRVLHDPGLLAYVDTQFPKFGDKP